jgi:alkanesulfonate monooxygenase SsuD/methylene tetrahydromethanopterin reductase-like flavin-dependent oxidoreductase (luciferase family)
MQFSLFSLMTQRERSLNAGEIYQSMVEHVQLAEQIGVDVAWFAEHTSCFMATPGLDHACVLRSMERFGADVMPILAGTGALSQPIPA